MYDIIPIKYISSMLYLLFCCENKPELVQKGVGGQTGHEATGLGAKTGLCLFFFNNTSMNSCNLSFIKYLSDLNELRKLIKFDFKIIIRIYVMTKTL